LRLESLERRELLASDMLFEMPVSGEYIVSVDNDLVVVRDATGATLVEHAADDVATLTVIGTPGHDTLVISETDAGLPRLTGDLSSGPGFASPSFLASGRVNADG